MTRSAGEVGWSWERAAPRSGLLFVAALFVFRVVLRLTWRGTIAATLVAFGGGAAVWLLMYRLSRRGPIMFASGGLGGRAVGYAIRRNKLDLRCPECGWAGHLRMLTESRSRDGIDLECPMCGRELAHKREELSVQ
jgi:predicted RNA-binding Zn-ribbon protein involved in translation (DUF1610 family)